MYKASLLKNYPVVSNLRPKQAKVRLDIHPKAGLPVLSFRSDGSTLLFSVPERSGLPCPLFRSATLLCSPALPCGSLVNALSLKRSKGTLKESVPTQSKWDHTTLEPSMLSQSANDCVAISPCSAVTASRSTGGLQQFLYSCLTRWLVVTQDWCSQQGAVPVFLPFYMASATYCTK